MTADPIDTAWRIHAAQVDWTGKVDSKASFALAIESGAMVAAIGFTGARGRLADIEGFWTHVCYVGGFAALGFALICVAWVVRPRLRMLAMYRQKEHHTNYVYFGHLRKQTAEQLAVTLAEPSDLLEVLSRQIVAMSKLCWRKHVLLQISLTLAVIGVALLGVSAILNG